MSRRRFRWERADVPHRQSQARAQPNRILRGRERVPWNARDPVSGSADRVPPVVAGEQIVEELGAQAPTRAARPVDV